MYSLEFECPGCGAIYDIDQNFSECPNQSCLENFEHIVEKVDNVPNEVLQVFLENSDANDVATRLESIYSVSYQEYIQEYVFPDNEFVQGHYNLLDVEQIINDYVNTNEFAYDACGVIWVYSP